MERCLPYLHVADLVSYGRALAAGYGVAAAQLEDGATIAGPGTLTPGGPGGPQGGVVLLLHRTLPEWMCRHTLYHVFSLVPNQDRVEIRPPQPSLRETYSVYKNMFFKSRLRVGQHFVVRSSRYAKELCPVSAPQPISIVLMAKWSLYCVRVYL